MGQGSQNDIKKQKLVNLKVKTNRLHKLKQDKKSSLLHPAQTDSPMLQIDPKVNRSKILFEFLCKTLLNSKMIQI